MSRIDIRHAHTLPPTHARQAVQDIADKLAQRFAFESRWDGDVLLFRRAGVDGAIELLPQQLRVTAELGFLMGAFKDRIEEEIRRVLGERFG
ncbi:MAG TPA: polyhydroxyalkanoic acid system family protein [Lysobacter sp.]|nr:polyhydroxyalkanoic acid system family protein [Lysobacter sp.]